jgi:putative phosphoribosyl transferase
VAGVLHAAGLGTALFDLLTSREAEARANVFDIPLLAGRLGAIARGLRAADRVGPVSMGYFGASTGAAAAMVAAASDSSIGAVVSRGGRPDLAMAELPSVRAPTLLIVGGDDPEVLEMNRAAYGALRCEKALEVVPGATHLFEEPGTLEAVASLAREWFVRHLGAGRELPGG